MYRVTVQLGGGERDGWAGNCLMSGFAAASHACGK